MGFMLGIDVSDNQGYIDWKKVKAAGVQFAILRSVRRSGNVDKQLASNIKGCKENSVPFQLYKYTYASTEVAARSEATAVAKALLKLGVPKGSRVWYDQEENSILVMGKAHVTKLYRAFKDELAKYGFVTGLYTGMYAYNTCINKTDFEDEAKWLARYYEGDKEMLFGTIPDEKYKPAPNIYGWQFTSSGTVPGINGPVDLDILWGDILVPDIALQYYDTPEFTLIDHLNKIGVDSSFKFRAKIAAENGIEGYVGSAEQNLKMLELLKAGKLEQV